MKDNLAAAIITNEKNEKMVNLSEFVDGLVDEIIERVDSAEDTINENFIQTILDELLESRQAYIINEAARLNQESIPTKIIYYIQSDICPEFTVLSNEQVTNSIEEVKHKIVECKNLNRQAPLSENTQWNSTRDLLKEVLTIKFASIFTGNNKECLELRILTKEREEKQDDHSITLETLIMFILIGIFILYVSYTRENIRNKG